MDIIYPSNGSKIYVPIEINGMPGKTIFKAAHRSSDAKIFWSLDEEFITTTTQFHQLALSPTPGKHTLTIVDDNGEIISRSFEILENK
jgi:penicillin-binding protein 1C